MQGTAPVLAVMTKADSQTQDRVQVTTCFCHDIPADGLHVFRSHTHFYRATFSDQCLGMRWASQLAALTYILSIAASLIIRHSCASPC